MELKIPGDTLALVSVRPMNRLHGPIGYIE